MPTNADKKVKERRKQNGAPESEKRKEKRMVRKKIKKRWKERKQSFK